MTYIKFMERLFKGVGPMWDSDSHDAEWVQT